MSPTGATEPFGGNGSRNASPRRAVEGATLVVIAATVVAVVASSWPIVIGWLDDTRPAPAKPGLARALRGRGWAVGPPEAKRPHRVFSPRQRLEIPFEDGLNAPHRLPIPPTESVAGAVAKPRTIVQLLDRADPEGRPVISVGPDETLIVVREITPWILLAVKRDGRVEFGWTTRSQVSIQN